MKRILVPVGCRSDAGLSAPIIKRLRDCFDVVVLDLIPQQFGQSYNLTEAMIYETRPDIILITGDRVEMCAAAAAAFHNKIKIAHFYAGIVNDHITTFDDVDRHCITLWSDIQFCENRVSGIRVNMLKQACEFSSNVYIVGISHLDDLEVDESKVPITSCTILNKIYPPIKTPYDLVLINEEPLSQKQPDPYCKKEGKLVIQIGGNPDGFSCKLIPNDIHYDNLPRSQFLGLLKNCQRFITNSSAAIYEAPHFLKPEQIVMVGDRNKNRPKGPFQIGASDRIVEILKEYLA